MKRTFVVTNNTETKKFTTTAETVDGIIRAAKKATGWDVDGSAIAPAWRSGWYPLNNAKVCEVLGIR